jgi:hypothetical protein
MGATRTLLEKPSIDVKMTDTMNIVYNQTGFQLHNLPLLTPADTHSTPFAFSFPLRVAFISNWASASPLPTPPSVTHPPYVHKLGAGGATLVYVINIFVHCINTLRPDPTTVVAVGYGTPEWH